MQQHNIRCDTYLGIGICEIIIILCAYIYRINIMNLPWDPSIAPKEQPIYSSVKKQILSNIRET